MQYNNNCPIVIGVYDGLAVNLNGGYYLTEAEADFLIQALKVAKKKARKEDIEKLNDEIARRKYDRHPQEPVVKKQKTGFIYIATDSTIPQYIKIGFSTNPSSREETLLAQKPTIKFEEVFGNATLFDEKKVHENIKQYRVIGEWFEVSIDTAREEIRKVLNAKSKL